MNGLRLHACVMHDRTLDPDAAIKNIWKLHRLCLQFCNKDVELLAWQAFHEASGRHEPSPFNENSIGLNRHEACPIATT